MSFSKLHKVVGFSFVFDLVVVDLVSKFVAQQHGLILLNTGFSGGIGVGIPNQVWIVLTLALASGMSWFLWNASQEVVSSRISSPWIVVTAIAFWWSGALGNLFDRVFFGGVRDWIRLPVLEVYNNLADWYLFIAVCLSMWIVMSDHKKV